MIAEKIGGELWVRICSLYRLYSKSQHFLVSLMVSVNNAGSSQEEPYRYKLIPATESYIIILDKKTVDYWKKYINPSEGPAEWEKPYSPITEKKWNK